MTIPLLDLKAQYLSIKTEVDAAIERVIDRSAFVGGDEVRAFETEFAAFCDADAAVGVGNGTDALYLALRALGLGPGDEVLTVAHTFIATGEAISLTGARPVFVDIRNDTMLMDPDGIEAKITARTRAIIAVHLYGQPCDMDRIVEIAERHRLKVIEDAAQAHGARWRGRKVGSLANVACFSFFPGKNLGAYGDAGAVVSRDAELIRRVRMLANHGRLDKYVHQMEGVNSRLDGLQAAVLRVKLRHLDRWNDARRAHAREYLRLFADAGVELPAVHPGAEPVWHLLVVRVSERDQLWKQLNERGIAAGIHYPIPLHQQPAYAHLGYHAGSLPVTEQVAARVLSVPLYAELSAEQVAAVSQTLHDAVCVQPPA
jgi:dTDP-4-amino-4,6-dideoxygalactose transaminase